MILANTGAAHIVDAIRSVAERAGLPPSSPPTGPAAITALPVAGRPALGHDERRGGTAVARVHAVAARPGASSKPTAPWPAYGAISSSRQPTTNGGRAPASLTLTFQQGVGGYSGATDTYIHATDPTNHAGSATLTVDVSPGPQQALVRFGALFASEGGPIPTGSTITSATLTINISNASASTIGFHPMLQPWADTALYATFGSAPWNATAGIQLDNVEAATAADASRSFPALGPQTVDVTARVQAWAADPSSNFGWVVNETVDDSVVFDSSEGATAGNRPQLSVTYDAPTSCVNNTDCADGNPCTDDVCDLGTGTCSNPNNSATCTDGNSCTTADVCAGGTCSGTPVGCPVGQSCNPSNGQCEALPGLPIAVGDTWKYFKGTVEPPAAWAGVAFDDTSWSTGPSGFGYGDGDDATVLSDMQGATQPPGYVSVYIRKAFSVPDPGSVVGLDLVIDYDDGFVAFLNGTEVARRGMTATAYNSVATSHEALAGGGGPVETISLDAYLGLLLPGMNVIAIHGANQAVDSSDLSLIPSLTATLSCATDDDCEDGNLCTDDLCNVGTGICSFPAVMCSVGETCNPSNGACETAPAPPNQPANPSPADGATGVSASAQLCAQVSDPNGDDLDVTFKGRLAGESSGQPFTIIAMPDTQYYACGSSCSSNTAIFGSQTQWILDNRASRNIAFVTQLGDCVEHGNDGNSGVPDAEWTVADAAFSLIENPVTTTLPDGIPYGVASGNHDQTPNGSPRNGSDEGEAFGGPGGTFTGTTAFQNRWFGRFRFAGRSYFGNNFDFGNPSLYADSMDNHYELFSASGMDFIIFHLEYDTTCAWPTGGSASCQAVLSWMRNLLSTTYVNRRAIVTTHWIATPGSTTAFSSQGQAIFNAIKDLPNVFLLLGGHLDQASHREDLATDGHKIFTIPTDYQSRPQGGGGWLRIMTFDPAANSIHIETYSPWYGRFINKPLPRHADDLSNESPSSTDPTAACYWNATTGTGHSTNGSCNELLLSYPMDSGGPYEESGTVTGVHSGDTVCVPWTGTALAPGATLQWYVEASDGQTTTTGPAWSFTTGTCTIDAECDDANLCTTDTCAAGSCNHAAIAGCCTTDAECDDANVCTTDTCNTGTNLCEHVDNALPCSDGDACTTGDACAGGACVGGAAPSCDDGNACTADMCSSPDGCVNAYIPVPGCCTVDADCDDGSANTIDTCSAGDCQNVLNPTCTSDAECDDADPCTSDACVGGNAFSLQLNGSSQRVTMGVAPGLGTQDFTLEAWINWNGSGATASSGTNGEIGIPIITKGVGEADDSNLDANYFFAIDAAGKLVADFESLEAPVGGNNNYPVQGSTALTTNVWHHVAVTYDAPPGTGCWQIYLDGVADTAGTTCPNMTPRYDSLQHFGIGAAITSTGTATGAFGGRIDEVRVWSVARTQAEIQASMGEALITGTGLIGRWGFEDGTTATDSTAPAENGTLVGSPVFDPANKPSLGTGSCQHDAVPSCCTLASECDDSNPCTNDTCEANVCQHTNNTAPCDDGNACTTPDACSGGVCGGTYDPFPACCSDDAQCDDGLPGTIDSCVGGDCQNVPDPTCTTDAECDDAEACTTDTCVGTNVSALKFDGTNDYVTMGTAPGLGSATFTLEGWIRRDGPAWGTVTNTGGQGVSGVPLITKGRGEQENSNVDCNYFLGITTSGRLVADFEQFAAGGSGSWPAGQNHPICSSALIGDQAWHHVAVSFDKAAGLGWRIYLDGVEVTAADGTSATCGSESTCTVAANCPQNPGVDPRYDSIQHFGLGTAMTSTGVADGFYAGLLDEVRVWNRALSPAEIQAGMSQALTSGTGLLGRWSLDENGGTSAADSVAAPTAEDGTLTNGPVWSAADKAPLAGGTCQHAVAPGCCTQDSDCDDGNVCTTDTCVGNSCTHVATNEGGSCDDGDACTQTDTCQSGACTGADPVICTASDQCHDAGICDTGTGLCSDPARANGSACSDGDACTQTDTCQSGVCTGANPVMCTASDQCHDAGICNTGTGLCSDPAKADGTTCDDADLCTTGDECTAGACAGSAIDCDDGNQCTADSCSAGLCENVATPGASCDDGSACTTGDVCSGGDVVDVVGTQDCTESEALTWNGTTAWINVDKAWTHTYAPIAGTIVGATLAIEIGDADGGPLTIVAGATTLGTITGGDNGGPGNFSPCASPGFTDNLLTIPPSLYADLADGTFDVTTSGCSPTCASAPTGPGTYGLTRAILTIQVAPTCGGTSVSGCCVSDGDCDDGNSCTVDTCVANACLHSPGNDGASCDDGSACTTAGECSGGACVGTAISCDDANPCTDDSCDAGIGCVHTDNTTPCASDGNPCTDDMCSAGACTHPANDANSCSDGVACTGDACVGGSCLSWYAPTVGCCDADANCDDGTASTTDTCVGGPGGSCSNLVTGSCASDAQCDDANGCTTDACVGAVGGSALNFDGVDDNVTMGTALGLGAATFTLEGWIKKDGASWGNANATTGTGGLSNIVALITKGRGEADATNQDCNYFLGITPGGRLVADFEQFAASTSPSLPAGQNRPICGTAASAITDSAWHHVAVTYDKTSGFGWRLYVDGVDVTAADGTPATCGSVSTCAAAANCPQNPGVDPRYDSIQHFALGIALNSTGAIQGTEGYFAGMMDEVRVWNRALSQAEIQAGMNQEITSGTGLPRSLGAQREHGYDGHRFRERSRRRERNAP